MADNKILFEEGTLKNTANELRGISCIFLRNFALYQRPKAVCELFSRRLPDCMHIHSHYIYKEL